MEKGLIQIILSEDIDGCKGFKRLDTGQLIDRQDFKVLQELPCLFIKPKDTIPQIGVFAHLTSLDFNEMIEEANAVLLSKRTIGYNNMEVYAGVYCRLNEKEDEGIRRLIEDQ